MTSDVFDTKFKTSLPGIRLENIGWKIRRSVSTKRHTVKLILFDPVEDEDVEDSSTDWSSNFDNARSREKKDYHSSDR